MKPPATAALSAKRPRSIVTSATITNLEIRILDVANHSLATEAAAKYHFPVT